MNENEMNPNEMNPNEMNLNENTKPPIEDSEEPIEKEPELGDKIRIIGGMLDDTEGIIYYFDETQLRILSSGTVDRLISLDVEDGVLKKEYGIQQLPVLRERTDPAFVVQQNYRVGNYAEGFYGPEGTHVGTYIIEAVDAKNDTVTLRDLNNELLEISCNYRGIPPEYHIDVLRAREREIQLEEGEEGEEGEEKQEGEEEGEGEGEEEGEGEGEGENENENENDFFFGEEEEVVKVTGGIEEIGSSSRIYSDNVQRSDMLQEFISKLELKAQKNPNRIKEIRRLTELCLMLRNEIIEYDINGIPLKGKNTSYTYLTDLAGASQSYLSRPVMDVRRVLYVDKPGGSTDNITVRTTRRQIDAEIKYADTELVGNQNSISDFPNWYSGWEKFNKEFFLSWSIKEKEGATSFSQDKEFFRMPYPEDDETKDVDGLQQIKLPSIFKKKDIEKPIIAADDYLGSVYISMLRGLKNRMGRLKEKESPRILESAEQGFVDSYLLFPKIYERELGTIRSGKLAFDVGRSKQTPRIIQSIMKEKEGVSNIPTADSILAVKNAVGTINIEDWLKNIPLTLYGLGDAIIELKSYGFGQKEFYDKQQRILVDKIHDSIAHVKSHIQYIRKKIEEEMVQEPKVNNFYEPNSYETFIDRIKSEDILGDSLASFKIKTPFYKNYDIAIFAALHLYAPDLLVAVLGGFPLNTAKYRTQYVNKEYGKKVQLKLHIAIHTEEQQYEPQINTCPHVKNINTIEKVQDDRERMELLTKFLRTYEKTKKNNFIICNSCDSHCLCEHTYLQLQEYQFPREKDRIHKELLLRFSAGVFQGKFICGNCGQAISNIEFDTSLEYSDSGAPMTGRAELVDTNEIEDEEINMLLGNENPMYEITFDTPAKKLYYQKTCELFDAIGISPDPDAYARIVNGIDTRVLSRPSIDIYTKLEKKAKSEGKKMDSYERFRNKVIIGTMLAYSIVEIQAHIPNYEVRASTMGCHIDFRGYPLGKKEDTRCIEYVACVAGTIIQKYAKSGKIDPWALCAFSTDKNNKAIVEYIIIIFNDIITLSTIQNMLLKKKEELAIIYGRSAQTEGLVESIPHAFTPNMDSSIEEIIVTGAANPHEKVHGYILQTHKLAKESIKKKGSFSEQTCCVGPIQNAQDFWQKQNLEVFPKSILRGPINSRSVLPFVLRKEAQLSFSISKNDYYKLFLKVCYTGTNIGLPHEFGYNTICPYCKLDLSALKDYDFKEQLTAKKDSEIEKAMYDRINQYNQMAISLLKNQSVEMSERSFDILLDAVHLKNSIIPDTLRSIDVRKSYTTLLNINPPPFEDWKIMIQEIQDKLEQLKEPSMDDYAIIYGNFATYATTSMNNIRELLGESHADNIKQIINQPIRQVIESVGIAILLPLQRIFMGYDVSQLILPNDGTYKELVGKIRIDINTVLEGHTNFIKLLGDNVTGFAESKIKYAIAQLSELLHTLQMHIRIPLLKGGMIGLAYILKAGITGILSDLITPNVSVPTNEEDNTSFDTTSRVPGNILMELLNKYKSEQFRLTEDEIRIAIGKRNEKEKQLFIDRFDKMGKDEKSVEHLKMKYGMGDWAVGGTKAIFTFNAAQYEREQDQLDQMNMLGYNAAEATEAAAVADGGYDNEQVNEDDM